MKELAIVFAVLFPLVAPAFAQKKPVLPKPAPPTISIELKEQFFKDQALLAAAQITLERTKEYQDHQQKLTAFQSVVQQLTSVCGVNFNIGLDKNGDPACIEKLPPATPETKPAVKK